MTNTYFKKLLTKLLKRYNIWYDMQPIDWNSPLMLYMDKFDVNVNISNIDNYIIINTKILEVERYENWQILNELNNPLNQPNIMVYLGKDGDLLIWSKQALYDLNIYDIEYWINLFCSIVDKLRQDINELNSLKNNLNNELSFRTLEKML